MYLQTIARVGSDQRLFTTGRFDAEHEKVEKSLFIALLQRCGLMPVEFQIQVVRDFEIGNAHIHSQEEVERQVRQMVSNRANQFALQDQQARTLELHPALCSC